MSAQIINLIAKRALKDVAKKEINSKDPFFENVPVCGRDGHPTGKMKKHKKGIPEGLSQNDGNVLKKVRRRAYRLDMSLFDFCGFKFGWSAVVAIIPVVGDLIDLLLAWTVVRACEGIDGGLPTSIQSRMYFNIALDFAIGLVPFLGDIADAVFRANTRNAWILEEYLLKKAETERALQAQNPGTGESGASLLKRPDAVNMLSGNLRNALVDADTPGRGDEEMAMGAVGGQAGRSRHNETGNGDGVETGVTRK